MPSFKDLKVGDEVFVVWQTRRHNDSPRTEVVAIPHVGRKYGYIDEHKQRPFFLSNGISHHSDCNARVNGFGFDVYRSREEWDAKVKAAADASRLAVRLTRNGYGLKQLPPEAVAAIHAVLDQHGL